MILGEIRKANIDDDFQKIAEIAMEGFETYVDFQMKNVTREESIDFYSKLMRLEHNEFSYRNIWLYVLEDGNIAGTLIGYRPDKIYEDLVLKDLRSLNVPLIVSKYRHFELKENIDPREEKTSSMYMHMVSVPEKYRGNKIGEMLTDKLCEHAKKLLCNYVYTDVKLNNDIVVNILKNNGFKPVRVIERDVLREKILCIRLARRINY